jgi:hypothetical protein
MNCFAEPVLTGDLYIVHKEEFSVTRYMWDTYTSQRRSLFIRENPILSLDRMLHKDYDGKGSVEKKISLVVSLKGLGVKTNCSAVNRQS